MLRAKPGSTDISKAATRMPFTTWAPAYRRSASCAAFSAAAASSCLRASAFSSTSLRMAPARSGVLLKKDFALRRASSIAWT